MLASFMIKLNDITNTISTNIILLLFRVFPIVRPKKIELSDFYKLKNYGFVKLNNFFNNDKIIIYQKVISNIINNEKFDMNLNGEVQAGNIKLNSLQRHSLFLKKEFRKYFYLFVSTFFYGYPKRPNIIFTFTSDGKMNNNYVKGKCKKQIAGDPHIDGYKHYLKIMIFLDDVGIENGPTNLLSGSHKNSKLQSLYKNNYYNKNNTKINQNLFSSIEKDHRINQLTGRKGDIYLVNTKNLHWAGDMNNGTREILWLYF